MSYKRRVKKGIPKNTDRCYGCKNIIVKPIYKYEEDTNSYYRDGDMYICKYMNIKSSKETVHEFLMNVTHEIYTQEELQNIIDDIDKSNSLHYGHKICGLYLYKEKCNGHFTKKDKDMVDCELSDDDIPF